jgi:hypothetical protein
MRQRCPWTPYLFIIVQEGVVANYTTSNIIEVGFSSLLHIFVFIIGCHNKGLIYVRVTHDTFQQGKNHNKIMKGPFYKNFIWIVSIFLKLNTKFYFTICAYNVFETLAYMHI